MARVSASEYAEKWSRRTKGAVQDYQAGIARTTEAPGAAAARQKSVYVANVQAASDRWARNVAAVPLSEWQQKSINKGAQRISSGVDAAGPTVAAKAGNILAAVDAAVGSLRSMPRGSLDQNIARSAEFARKMAAHKGKI